jgi:hypothetical protein
LKRNNEEQFFLRRDCLLCDGEVQVASAKVPVARANGALAQ